MGVLQEYLRKFQEEHAENMPKFNPAEMEIITISRTTGCGARQIADRLAKQLGYKVWDSEILTSICQNMELSKSRYHLLDENRFALGKNYMGDFFDDKGLSNFTYKKELTKLLYTICLNNKAIIIGRGANFFIKNALHVRLDADINKRITKIAEDLNSSRIAAKNFILKTDKARTKFVQTCFGKERVKNFKYDLTVDTDNFTYDDVCKIIATAMECHKENLKKEYID